MTSSSRDLLAKLREARNDDAVMSVLMTTPARGGRDWLNMNQSPPRSLLRDTVDARESVGVEKWLSYHQHELSQSERRRVDNRLKAQAVFDASQAELADLRADVSRLAGRITSTEEIDRSQHTNGTERPAQREAGVGVVSTPAPREERLVVPDARDTSLLMEGISTRDDVIERLQAQHTDNAHFYEGELEKLRGELRAVVRDRDARLAALQGRLERSLLARNDSEASPGREGPPQALLDGIDATVQELQATFHNHLEALKGSTAAQLGDHIRDIESRVADLAAASERAVRGSRDAYRAKRLAALQLQKENVVNSAIADQDAALRVAETRIQERLVQELGEQLNADMDAKFRRELQSHVLPPLRLYLEKDVRDRVVVAVDADLHRVVSEQLALISQAFESGVTKAESRLMQTAASRAGVDKAGVEHVLASVQDELRDLRRSAEAAASQQQAEHVQFMAKASSVVDHIRFAGRKRDLYATPAHFTGSNPTSEAVVPAVSPSPSPEHTLPDGAEEAHSETRATSGPDDDEEPVPLQHAAADTPTHVEDAIEGPID